MNIIEIDGRPASVDDLGALAFAGYGHFTFMQVRGGLTRGLALHFDRLRLASEELFGNAIDGDRVHSFLRRAVRQSPGDCSAQVVIYSVDGDAVHRGQAATLSVLVKVSPPWNVNPEPLRMRTTMYERFLPHIKNVATLGLTYHTRSAQRDGFDDVVFIDRDGFISEASIWNIAFHDGTDVIWPSAPALRGIAMSIAQRGLDRLGVSQRTAAIHHTGLDGFESVALMNSLTPGMPVAHINGTTFSRQKDLASLLHRAHESEPGEPI